jgi:hypothetical protein
MRLWKPDASCDPIRQAGGPEILNWTPIDVSEPGSGQVRLRQAAAARARATSGFTILTS